MEPKINFFIIKNKKRCCREQWKVKIARRFSDINRVENTMQQNVYEYNLNKHQFDSCPDSASLKVLMLF